MIKGTHMVTIRNRTSINNDYILALLNVKLLMVDTRNYLSLLYFH